MSSSKQQQPLIIRPAHNCEYIAITIIIIIILYIQSQQSQSLVVASISQISHMLYAVHLYITHQQEWLLLWLFYIPVLLLVVGGYTATLTHYRLSLYRSTYTHVKYTYIYMNQPHTADSSSSSSSTCITSQPLATYKTSSLHHQL